MHGNKQILIYVPKVATYQKLMSNELVSRCNMYHTISVGFPMGYPNAEVHGTKRRFKVFFKLFQPAGQTQLLVSNGLEVLQPFARNWHCLVSNTPIGLMMDLT